MANCIHQHNYFDDVAIKLDRERAGPPSKCFLLGGPVGGHLIKLLYESRLVNNLYRKSCRSWPTCWLKGMIHLDFDHYPDHGVQMPLSRTDLWGGCYSKSPQAN